MAPTNPPFEPTFLNLEYLFYKIYQLFHAIYNFFANTDFFAKLLKLLAVLLPLAAILFITVIIYTMIRISEIKKEEKEGLKKFIIRDPATTGKQVHDGWRKGCQFHFATKISSATLSNSLKSSSLVRMLVSIFLNLWRIPFASSRKRS